MARRAPYQHDTEHGPDATGSDAFDPDAFGMAPPGASTDRAQPDYFDQALFDLRYHLLALRVEGPPLLPNLEDYGLAVDRCGNVTRTAAQTAPDS